MKKLLLIVVISTLWLGASAQTQFGIKFGLNKSKLSPVFDSTNDKSDRKDYYNKHIKSNNGFNFGLVYTSENDKAFTFQAELAFSQKGALKSDKDGKTVGGIRYNYIDFKPLFNVGAGGDSWKLYFQFGPSVNFWLSKKMYDKDGKLVDGSEKWNTDNDEEGAGAFDVRGELGLIAGAGFKYKLGPGWILVNPRYEWGISPTTIYDLGNDGFSEVNRTLSVNMGYLFEF